ncbi:MAG: hypothetical protein KBB11_00560 [Bacteroidales bacterium]|jgi:hypothetical protein|nr:hypothetical protein [Bacteroidales bacterium]
MKSICVFCVLCFIVAPSFSQWVFQKEVPFSSGNVGVDVLGNLYVFDSFQIKKTDSNGKVVFSYANKNLGEITSADVTDPMRIMLFYGDFNYLVFLDNSLSLLRDPVSLDGLNLNRAEVVCASQKGGFWVFDSGDLRLKYFSSNLQQLNESNAIDVDVSNDKSISLKEFTDYVCLVFEKNGCFVFDKFGNYVFRIQEQGFSAPYVNNGYLYYIMKNELVEHNLKLHNETKIQLPVDNSIQVLFNGTLLYVRQGDKLQIYFLVEN